MSQTNLPDRSQVPPDQTWELESIFATPSEWEAAYKEVEALLPTIKPFQGKLSQGPRLLADCLAQAEKIRRLTAKVGVYAMLESAANALDQEALARSGQARALAARTGAAVAFIEPELMLIGFETLTSWMQEQPRLKDYAYYFEKLERLQPHVRSAEVEEVLAMSGDPLGTALASIDLLINAEIPFRPALDEAGREMEVGQSSIGALVTHTDRRVRQTAWESYADGYLAFKRTLANSLTAAVKRDVFAMRVRGYPSALQASLAPGNIPVDVFHNLIQVFRRNLPTWHRYWRIRRQALGYESFHVYDIKAPLAYETVRVTYDEAVSWIALGMAPLGESYVETLVRGCRDERWVDYACNKGKRQGAFSSGTYDTHPYIMMSFNDDLFSLSTLAHELGHSMHSYYSRKTQPYINSSYSLFVAEVASNFNQAMVRDYMLKTQTSPAFQMGLIEEAMSNFHRYFFIMPTLARFELEMHQRVERGEPLSAQILINLMAELFREGYGDEVEFDHDRIGITWAQFSHLYMNFYVYQYATGISGAHALVDGILSGKTGAALAYLEFLKAGGSMDPLECLKRAGVDLTTPQPVERAFAYLASLVDRLETLLGSPGLTSPPGP